MSLEGRDLPVASAPKLAVDRGDAFLPETGHSQRVRWVDIRPWPPACKLT